MIEEKTENIHNGTRTTRTITTTEVNQEGFEVTSIQTIVTDVITSTRVSLETKVRKMPFAIRGVEVAEGTTPQKAKRNPPTPPNLPGNVVLDKHMYPHLFETIVRHAPPQSLLKLRGTSKAVQDLVDDRLFRHITVAHGALRTRYGMVWFDRDDLRATKAVAFDLLAQHDDYSLIPGVAPLLKQLRLIRTSDSSFLSFGPSSPKESTTALAEGKELDVWHVTFSDLTSQQRGGAYQWEAVNTAQIQNWVLNITYDPTHQQFPEKGLGEIQPPTNKALYILFTPFKSPDAYWENETAKSAPPVRPRLLNTLLQTLIVSYSTKICLVEVDRWNQEWLNRKFEIGGAQLNEETPQEADMKTRLQWWIQELDANVGASASNISFISQDDFRARVPTQEMYELIMSL